MSIVYTVSCKCDNCFSNFSVDIPKGTKLEKNTWYAMGLAYSKEGQQFKEHVKCPNCGCDEVYKVQK